MKASGSSGVMLVRLGNTRRIVIQTSAKGKPSAGWRYACENTPSLAYEGHIKNRPFLVLRSRKDNITQVKDFVNRGKYYEK